jgi:hypothetical protein
MTGWLPTSSAAAAVRVLRSHAAASGLAAPLHRALACAKAQPDSFHAYCIRVPSAPVSQACAACALPWRAQRSLPQAMMSAARLGRHDKASCGEMGSGRCRCTDGRPYLCTPDLAAPTAHVYDANALPPGPSQSADEAGLPRHEVHCVLPGLRGREGETQRTRKARANARLNAYASFFLVAAGHP